MLEKRPSRIEREAAKFVNSQRDFATAITEVTNIYSSFGYRKIAADRLPLRFEVDSFLADIAGELGSDTNAIIFTLRSPADRKALISNQIKLWESKPDTYLSEVANVLLPKLQAVFASTESIHKATDGQIAQALKATRSFFARSRRYKGGYEGLCAALFEKNSATQIRNSFSYLLFGSDAFSIRLASLSNPSPYKVVEFGPANALELLGRCGREGHPIATSRTRIALRYLGFDIAVN
jgi:hypothetical protein